MQSISKYQVRRVMPRLKKGCLHCGNSPVEIDHALIYSGRQINDDWNLQPLCAVCHRGENGTVKRRAKLKSMINAIELGLDFDIENKYPKRDWKQELKKYKHELSD